VTLIHRFSDLDHFTSYFLSTIEDTHPVSLNSDNVQSLAEQYSMSSSVISEVSSSPYRFYLYTFSKTSYRKNVHPYIPNVLYKRMYNTLKLSNVIREATGSIVLLHLLPFTQEMYDSISISSDLDNLKVLNNIIDNFSNINSDNQYYIDYIKSLEQECAELRSLNSQLLEQIQNSKLVTWY